MDPLDPSIPSLQMQLSVKGHIASLSPDMYDMYAGSDARVIPSEMVPVLAPRRNPATEIQA